ncbi:MAG: glycosyltransferase [Nibricoccus sp.]
MTSDAVRPVSPASNTTRPRSGRPPRILFFTRILPEKSSSGAASYTFDLLSYLRNQGCSVRIAWTELPYEAHCSFRTQLPEESASAFDIRARDFKRSGRTLYNFDAVWLPLKARTLHSIKRLLSPVWRPRSRTSTPQVSSTASSPAAENNSSPPPAQRSWNSPSSPAELSFLEKHIRDFEPDVLFVNYTWLLSGIASLQPRCPTWVLAHDFRFRRCRIQEGKFLETFDEGAELQEEKGWLSAASLVIAIQETEARCFRRLLPEKEVTTAYMSTALSPVLPDSSAPICAFVGSSHQPNKDAAGWFIREIWPIVRARFPDARFRVAGRVSDHLSAFSNVPGVELLGLVPSLEDFYAKAAAVVVPLREGSGVKIKLVEAVAHGRACVTTSVGADGLEFLKPGLAMADHADAFAAETIRLLNSKTDRETLVTTARNLAADRLSPDACYHELAERAHIVAGRQP